MDQIKTGKLIRRLRQKKNMTQLELAEKIGVSDKAVSKWERGCGAPDISLFPILSATLGADVAALLKGDLDENKTSNGNMKKLQFYICPDCDNLLFSTDNADVSCCGKKLVPIKPQKADESTTKFASKFTPTSTRNATSADDSPTASTNEHKPFTAFDAKHQTIDNCFNNTDDCQPTADKSDSSAIDGTDQNHQTSTNITRAHQLNLQISDGEWYITGDHKMKREHYISFVAFLTGDTFIVKKLYPEWNLETRLPFFAHGTLFWYCTKHGLFYKEV